jgi:hypothetical protein
MQLVPSTATWVNEQSGESLDYMISTDNMKTGILYLHILRKELEKYTDGEDLDKLIVANYNCGMIDDLAKKYCTKGEAGCWDKVEKYIHAEEGGTFCQTGQKDQTYNHVKDIIKYRECYRKNPDCYYACFTATCKERVLGNV